MTPNEYALLPRDSKRERDTLKWLRSQNEHDKFTFIWRVLKKNPGIGLVLVEKAQLKPVYLEVILELGFVYGDASSVRWWYEATVNGLGQKRVIEMVAGHLDDAPLILDKMLYWLRPEDESLKKQVHTLREQFVKKYPNFNSTRSTGIHATKA